MKSKKQKKIEITEADTKILQGYCDEAIEGVHRQMINFVCKKAEEADLEGNVEDGFGDLVTLQAYQLFSKLVGEISKRAKLSVQLIRKEARKKNDHTPMP